MTLTDWSAVAQIAATLIGAAGIVTSMLMSVKALREIHRDRVLRHRPHLAFEGGGWQLPVAFVKAGRRIPGVDPAAVERFFSSMPDEAVSVRLRDSREEGARAKPIFFGQLRNFGPGAAIETHVTWVVERLTIGGESFDVDGKKQNEPRYQRSLNRIPATPQHIQADAEAKLSRLPTFIDKDWERKIQEAEGVLEISCHDILGNEYLSRQRFWLSTGYQDAEPYVHVTFREPIDGLTGR